MTEPKSPKRSYRRRLRDLQPDDRIIIWMSPSERDVMPCCDESYETSEVVTIAAITDWVDYTYLIDVDGPGKLLVYGDGLGGPEFRLAKTIWDRVLDDDEDEPEDF